LSGGDIATPMANNGYPGENGIKTNLWKPCQKDGKLILYHTAQDQ
jgi:hypothetical protein